MNIPSLCLFLTPSYVISLWDYTQIIQKEITPIINPTKKVKDLERKIIFSDTIQNRVDLTEALQTIKTNPILYTMKEIIQSHSNVSDEVYQLFLNAAKKKEAPKNQLVFHPQKVNDKCLFIEKGILRGYKIIDGKEYTHHFYFSNWFATDFKSYLTNKPSEIYIETLTDAVYYEFDKKNLLELYSQHHPLEKLGRIIAEKAYLFTVEKLSNMQTLDLKERYKNLVEKNPELFQRVPQKHIASYLGVSEQSLSRIKKNLIS
ncbi:MAG: CRP-like cAMP-binding protein [Dokdonia sp.]